MRKNDRTEESLQRMIDMMMDDNNFRDEGSAKIMIARAEAVQKLVSSKLEDDRNQIDSARVAVSIMEIAGKYQISEDSNIYKTAIGIAE